MLFNQSVEQNVMQTLDYVLTAISDPTRRAIIDRLTRGPARVTDVAEPFDMSLNAVSKHIKVLESAGLVRRVRNGREHTLELDAEPLQHVKSWVLRYEPYWTERLDRLEAFFAKQQEKKK
jgi:DNA-binding transcriptional ArsR family regulator